LLFDTWQRQAQLRAIHAAAGVGRPCCRMWSLVEAPQVEQMLPFEEELPPALIE